MISTRPMCVANKCYFHLHVLQVIKQVTNELDEKNKQVQQQHEELQIQKLEIEAAKADMAGMRSIKEIDMEELEDTNRVLQSSLDDKQQSRQTANKLFRKRSTKAKAVNPKQKDISVLQQKVFTKSMILCHHNYQIENGQRM